MSRYVLLLIAGVLFHFPAAEIYSRPSPESASGRLESPECKGRRRFRSPAAATPRPPRSKVFFYGTVARLPSLGPVYREKSTRIPPSSYPFENNDSSRDNKLLLLFVGLTILIDSFWICVKMAQALRRQQKPILESGSFWGELPICSTVNRNVGPVLSGRRSKYSIDHGWSALISSAPGTGNSAPR